jgi:hypothetical protein
MNIEYRCNINKNNIEISLIIELNIFVLYFVVKMKHFVNINSNYASFT